jgi:hypothetical protein
MNEYSFYMGNHNAYSITPIFENVIRIRYNGTGVFNQTLMERYDIINPPSVDIESALITDNGLKTIISGNLRIRVQENASFCVEHKEKKIIENMIDDDDVTALTILV